MNSDNLWYLFAAYGIIWLAVFGYVVMLVSRQRAMRRDIDALKKELKK
ncbi:MAG: CcmD family protein [Dehalococcoidia bacterium]|nr:CcmD family protein [Dehalococcoidia bacterium]